MYVLRGMLGLCCPWPHWQSKQALLHLAFVLLQQLHQDALQQLLKSTCPSSSPSPRHHVSSLAPSSWTPFEQRVCMGCSGRFCEVVDCGSGDCVAWGTTSTKQTSRRWAAMRLLQELEYIIDPAFFKNTLEGM